MASNPEANPQDFNLPGDLELQSGEAGLPCVFIDTADCSARQYLLGANPTSWQPEGHEPVLFVSKQAVYKAGSPIRGGVPICFPWFGPHPSDTEAPAHGLVRTEPWTLTKTAKSREGVEVEMLHSIEYLHATFRVCFGRELHMELAITNPTDSDQRFEAALHTYFVVGDIRKVKIAGLENCRFVDKLREAKTFDPAGELITFDGELDRVYDHDGDAVLHDAEMRRRIRVAKEGSASTVVWNPWIEKSKRLEDFGNDEWPGMCCIESANIGEHAVTLSPGQTHRLAVRIAVEHAGSAEES